MRLPWRRLGGAPRLTAALSGGAPKPEKQVPSLVPRSMSAESFSKCMFDRRY